jgi:hypothetical protein
VEVFHFQLLFVDDLHLLLVTMLHHQVLLGWFDHLLLHLPRILFVWDLHLDEVNPIYQPGAEIFLACCIFTKQ